MTEQFKSIPCDGCGRQLTIDVSEREGISIAIVCKVCGYEHSCLIHLGEIARIPTMRASTKTGATATNVYYHVTEKEN